MIRNMSKKGKKNKDRTKEKKDGGDGVSKDEKETENPWAFCDSLPTLMEDDKLNKASIAKHSCIDKFGIKQVQVSYVSETARNNEIYKLFGNLVGQDTNFMQHWLCVFSELNKKYVTSLASSYYKALQTNLAKWILGVKSDSRADILAIFLLCKNQMPLFYSSH